MSTGPIPETRDDRFRKELESLVNRHSRENGCDTPDFVLAQYLLGCLNAFDLAVRQRESWYGRYCSDGRAILRGPAASGDEAGLPLVDHKATERQHPPTAQAEKEKP